MSRPWPLSRSRQGHGSSEAVLSLSTTHDHGHRRRRGETRQTILTNTWTSTVPSTLSLAHRMLVPDPLLRPRRCIRGFGPSDFRPRNSTRRTQRPSTLSPRESQLRLLEHLSHRVRDCICRPLSAVPYHHVRAHACQDTVAPSCRFVDIEAQPFGLVQPLKSASTCLSEPSECVDLGT
jgi:hypothetical protein